MGVIIFKENHSNATRSIFNFSIDIILGIYYNMANYCYEL